MGLEMLPEQRPTHIVSRRVDVLLGHPTTNMSRVDVLLGHPTHRVLFVWVCVMYVLSFFGILLTNAIYTADLVDWRSAGVIAAATANGVAGLLLVSLLFVREQYYIFIKAAAYLCLPAFTYVQLGIVLANMRNFTDIFEAIIAKIDDGTQLWHTDTYWIVVLCVCAGCSFLCIFVSNLATVCATPVVVFVQFAVLCAGFFFMIVFPFCFFVYHITCLFLLMPALLLYDAAYIYTHIL